MSKRKFTWNAWNYDGDGQAYIVAKDQCPNRDDLFDYIHRVDNVPMDHFEDMKDSIREGWCKYQCRTDWNGYEGEPIGFYVVEDYEPMTKDLYGKRKPGWFPVWMVRKGEWF